MSAVLMLSLGAVLGIALGMNHVFWLVVALTAVTAFFVTLVTLRRGLILSLLLAVLITGGYLRTFYVPEMPTLSGRQQITGRALHDPVQITSGLFRGLVAVDSPGQRFRLQLYSRVPWREGEVLRLAGELKRPAAPLNPGEVDYGGFLERQGIAGHFFADELKVMARFRPGLISLMRAFVRSNMAQLADEPRGLARALVLGDRGTMPAAERENWRVAGVSHVLAVSGTHITIFAGAGYLLLRRFVGYRTAYFWAGCLAIVYALLVGESLSAWRAALTFALVAIANIALRKSDPVHLLALVGAVMLFISPDAIMDAGFLLSFSATAGLVLLTPIFLKLLSGPKYLRYLVAASLAAQLFTLPIIVNIFHAWPVYGLLSNLVLVPFSSVLLYAAFLVGLVGRVPGIGWLVRGVFSLASLLASWFVSVVANLPFATFYLVAMPLFLVAIFYGIVAMMVYFRQVHRGVVALLLVALLAVAVLPTIINDSSTTMTFLSLGQAEAIHLTLGGRHFLVNAASAEAARHIVVPYLRSQGVNALQAIFLTSEHANFAGGLAEVTRAVAVAKVIIGADIARAQYGTALLTAIPSPSVDLERHHAVTMLLQDRSFKALLTLAGDMATEATARDWLGRIAVFKVPTQNAGNAFPDAFLKTASPQVVVRGASPRRGGGLQEGLTRQLQENGIMDLRTDERGAVRIRVTRFYYQVSTYREGRWRHVRAYVIPRASQ
ncbi:MAG: ComEC/Rec2 family competence protein [Peptococcaceae bacterium]|nr:ComEC/Rec2 family competence protein [Peptococcaceae bacterium]